MQLSLEVLFEKAIDELEVKFEAFPLEDREVYRAWLNQQFYLVQNSTRYLALSASKVDLFDRLEFRDWVHHLEEELDHDQLILNDLKRLKSPHSDPPNPITRALIFTQYQEIEKNGPNALLGYALMLEGLSARICSKLSNRVTAAYGRGVDSYLRFHAKVDADHYPEGLKKIQKLSSEQAKVVRDNLETMFVLYVAQLESLSNSQLGIGFSEMPERSSSVRQVKMAR